ncbi:hypothetical protein MAUB_39860 [Mycolicibacterium aubagnense]|uniref:DUF2510 domain-containing protein n=2 Tax=Mycolicibacterium aubagnense TaxID=319707 RepID=A0ABM7IHG9_9MYCO|nr:hypothetical protein C1S80_02960 [Mycolicibacterium aubagnense]BBX86113.1 hypothetical protein MAUB_39860 [Mycolicibacterium aubagnense]
MNNMPGGWYPDPGGGPNLRYFDGQAWSPIGDVPQVSGGKKRSPWLWVLGGVAVLLTVVMVGGTWWWHKVATTTPPTTTVANQAAPQSKIIPTLTLPAGSKQERTNDPHRFEEWVVPSSYAETVRAVRKGLPIGVSFDGLAWCAESTSKNLTIWSWGTTADYLSVHASGSSLGGTSVSIGREPDVGGCLH